MNKQKKPAFTKDDYFAFLNNTFKPGRPSHSEGQSDVKQRLLQAIMKRKSKTW